jgi:hypothetical protein
MMMHSTMTMGDNECLAVAQVLAHIHGARCNVSASLTVERPTRNYPWLHGKCDLHMVDDPDRDWRFTGRVEDHQLKVELTGHPDLAQPEYQYAHPGPGPHQHD